MYPTSILGVQYLQIGLHNDDSEVVWCAEKQIRPSGHNVHYYLHTSEDCTIIRDGKPSIPAIYMKPTAYDGTTTSATQPSHDTHPTACPWALHIVSVVPSECDHNTELCSKYDFCRIYLSVSRKQMTSVQSYHNRVNFLHDTHNRHPIVCLWGWCIWGMNLST